MRLDKGKKAETKKGMKHNVKVMEKAGYPKRRAEGAAYGEVGMSKMASRHESEGMKKSMSKKKPTDKLAKHEKAEMKVLKTIKKAVMKGK